jgi:hypothetical protein
MAKWLSKVGERILNADVPQDNGNNVWEYPKSLPAVSMYASTSWHEPVGDFQTSAGLSQMSINQVTEAVKKSLGYLEKPLIKCRHCGQWGAAYCACAYCGAAIDPE